MKIGKKEWITRKKKNKAFTLIELLAVIVILGVIALIVTPVVTGVIKKSEKNSFARSIDGLVESVRINYSSDSFQLPREYYYEKRKLNLIKIKNQTVDENVPINGKIDGSGFIYVDGDGVIHVDNICNDTYCANGDEDNIIITDKPGETDPDTSRDDPMITLNGEAIVTIGIGSTFTDPGATARTKGGNPLEYQTEIQKESSVVTEIDTSKLSTYKITYSVTNNNKTVSVSRTVEVVDKMGPIITFNPEIVRLTIDEVKTYNLCTGVTIIDNLDGEIDCSNAKTTGILENNPGTYPITYRITDSLGNSTEKTRTFIVVDTEKPIITIDPNEQTTYVKEKKINISATDHGEITSLSYVITKDGVAGTRTSVTGTNETITLNETGIYTITVTATDSNNNTETKTSGEYKIDKTPPTLTIPEDSTILSTEVNTFNILDGVIARDNTGEEVKVTTTSDLDITEGVHTITYTATDKAGNTTTKTRKITVEKDEGPILNFSVAGGANWYKTLTVKVTATAKSNLKSFTYEIFKNEVSEGVQSVSVSGKSAEKSITLDKEGIYTIKLTATDQNSTSTVTSGTYRIDTTAPVITLNPETVELTIEESKTYNLLTGVSVNDNVDGNIDPSRVTTKGSVASVTGTYIIIYTVSDSVGNKTEKTRTFIVTDSEKPKITINPNEQTTYVKEKNITISATDNVKVNSLSYVITKDGVAGTSNIVSGTSKSITLNETGIYKVTVTATDSNNNTETKTSGEYKIDKIPPTLTIPGNATINTTEVGSFNPRNGVTMSDNTGITPTLEVSGIIENAPGSYQITYKAIDEAGNETTKTRTITVEEDEGPILNFSDVGGSNWRRATTIRLTATDNSNLQSFTYEIFKNNISQGVKTVSVSGKSAEKSVTLDQDGTYTITLNGSDIYGNTSTATSSTYNIDTTPPTAGTATFSGTIGSNNWYTSNVYVYVSDGSDALSGHSSTTSNVSSITSNTSGTTVRITTTDLAGNSASRTYTIKVDKYSPTLTLKSTGYATINQGASVSVSSYYNVSYSTSGGSMSCSPTNTSSLSSGTRTVSCTARGGNGLQQTVSKTVIVEEPVSVVTKVYSSDETMTNDPGGNPRYVGSNPNNYVWFNDELWRIIGVFGGQAKIIKNDFYSTSMAWDKNSSQGGHGTYGYNDWTTATLKTELNGTYLNGMSSTAKSLIDQNYFWNLGGAPSSASNSDFTRENMYNYERGTSVYSGRPTNWTGAVGLMYPSDYGYSTSATDSECNVTMDSWGRSDFAVCRNNSWLYNSSYNQWAITPTGNKESWVFAIYRSGLAGVTHAKEVYGIRPVVFLQSDVKITSGTGTSSDPFRLSY